MLGGVSKRPRHVHDFLLNSESIYLAIEFSSAIVALEKIIESPLDAVEGVVLLAGAVVAIFEIDDSPDERRGGPSHGEAELHVVAG